DKLMHTATAAKNRIITDHTMTADHYIIGKCYVIADFAIMRHMGIGQEGAIITDIGITTAGVRTAMHGHAFADHAIFTDQQLGRATCMLSVRRLATQNSMQENLGIFAKRCETLHNHMAHQFAIVTNNGTGLHMTESAN